MGAKAVEPGSGTSDDPEFVWGDGSPMNFPKTWLWYGRYGDCLTVWPSGGYMGGGYYGQLHSRPCDGRYEKAAYVCEYN